MAGERALPGLGLYGFWNAGTGGWKTETDNNWRKLSALLHLSVKSNTTNLPTGANGDIYIVPTGQPNAQKIAVKDNGSWVYIDPLEGMRAFIKDQDVFKWFNGTNWITEGAALSVLSDHDEFMALVSEIDFVGNGVELEEDEENPGRLIVTITKPSVFGDLPQVDFSEPPADGQTLVWDGPDQVWRPGTVAGGGGGGDFPEAPEDGKTYGRKDGEWSEIVSGGGGSGGLTAYLPRAFRYWKIGVWREPDKVNGYWQVGEVGLQNSTTEVEPMPTFARSGTAPSAWTDGILNNETDGTGLTYVIMDFTTPKRFSTLRWRSANGSGGASLSDLLGEVHGSDDGVTWVEIATNIDPPFTDYRQERFIALPIPMTEASLPLEAEALTPGRALVINEDGDGIALLELPGAVLVPKSYRRYRLTFPTSAQPYPCMSEIAALDLQGDNIQIDSIVASSNYGSNPGSYSPDKAIDGNQDTFWHSGSNTNEFLELRFNDPVAVNSFTLTVKGQADSQRPTSVVIEASEDTLTYEEVLALQNITWVGSGVKTANFGIPGAYKVLDLSEVLAAGLEGQVLTKKSDADFDFEWVTPATGASSKRKFNRYRVTLGSGGELLLSELTFIDSNNTTVVPTSTATNDSNTADVPKLFDGNDTTFWYGGQPRYFDCTFAVPFALAEVYLLQKNGQAYKNATSLKVEGYDDGWVELFDGGITMTPYAGNADNGEYTQAIDTGAAPPSNLITVEIDPADMIPGQMLVVNATGDGFTTVPV